MSRAEDYMVGWISALPVELAAATEMLDEEHPELPHDPSDDKIYTLGRVGSHNVVMACLPSGRCGTTSAATVAVQMRARFPRLRFGLMVGVGGGVPSSADVRLGDVVVGQPSSQHGGVVQYDSGAATASGFVRKGVLNAPPTILLNALSKLRANHLRHRSKVMEYLSAFDGLPRFQRANAGDDRLFASAYAHFGGPTCVYCREDYLVARTPRGSEDVEIHYGNIASGNQVTKSGRTRDQLSAELGGVLCFEMEAAGLMNGFPCLVIRGICDYCDSHKNKSWQPFAAAAAAAYAKDLLSVVPGADVQSTSVSRHQPLGLSANQEILTSRVPEETPAVDASNIYMLAQTAHELHKWLRGFKGGSSPVKELAHELFSLHSTLKRLADCIHDGIARTSELETLTSNVFKRPDLLISRCNDVLRELQTFPNNPAQWEIEGLHSEVQWCSSFINLLLDVLLQPKKKATNLKIPSWYEAMGLSQPEYAPEEQFKQARRHRTRPREAPAPGRTQRAPEVRYLLGSEASDNAAAAFSPDITAQTGAAYSPFSPDIMTPLPFSVLTIPEEWLDTIQLELAAWESGAYESAETKRTRQGYVMAVLTSLNSHLMCMKDASARRRLRKELEQYGLLRVMNRMKSWVDDFGMLEKQIQLYFDSKMDDVW